MTTKPSGFTKNRQSNFSNFKSRVKRLAFFTRVFMDKPFRRRDLLGIRDLSAAEITGILNTAENFSEINKR